MLHAQDESWQHVVAVSAQMLQSLAFVHIYAVQQPESVSEADIAMLTCIVDRILRAMLW